MGACSTTHGVSGAVGASADTGVVTTCAGSGGVLGAEATGAPGGWGLAGSNGFRAFAFGLLRDATRGLVSGWNRGGDGTGGLIGS